MCSSVIHSSIAYATLSGQHAEALALARSRSSLSRSLPPNGSLSDPKDGVPKRLPSHFLRDTPTSSALLRQKLHPRVAENEQEH